MPVDRVTGIASGMDIEGTVKKLMAAEKIPLDKLFQKKQLAEWKRDEFRTMSTKLMDLRTTSFSMRLESSTLVKKASLSDESYFSVSATSTAYEGNYSLKVNQLATTAMQSSSSTLGLGGSTTKVLNQMIPGVSGNFDLQIIGEKGVETVTVNATGTVGDLITQINNKTSTTGVRMIYDSGLDRMTLMSVNSGTKARIHFDAADADQAKIDALWTGFGFANGGKTVRGSSLGSGADTQIVNNGTLTINLADGTSRSFTATGGATKVGEMISSMNADAELQKKRC